MDRTRDTVLHLSVQLWESVSIVDTSFLNVSDSSLFNNVPDDESLDSLIFGAAFPAVGAPDGVHVTTVVLVPATIPALESHVAAESFVAATEEERAVALK
uniref:Uncharacterized protein n=1 Tax=Noccaea caerulescens TaxID=107243 RepID=A0A1J3HAK2_NOCCA